MDKGRLEAFSDGVIAIIITITILLIDLPDGNDWPDLLVLLHFLCDHRYKLGQPPPSLTSCRSGQWQDPLG